MAKPGDRLRYSHLYGSISPGDADWVPLTFTFVRGGGGVCIADPSIILFEKKKQLQPCKSSGLSILAFYDIASRWNEGFRASEAYESPSVAGTPGDSAGRYSGVRWTDGGWEGSGPFLWCSFEQ